MVVRMALNKKECSFGQEAIASRFSLVGDGFDALRPARVSEASHVQAGAWKWLCVLG